MNQVSWLIYLSGVAENVGGVFIFLGIVALIVGIAYFVCACEFLFEISKWDDSEVKILAIKTFKKQRFTSTLNLLLASVLWLLAAITPSQNTVLAIAASQFGEQLLHTKTANLAEQALNSWLQKQITKTTDAAKK